MLDSTRLAVMSQERKQLGTRQRKTNSGMVKLSHRVVEYINVAVDKTRLWRTLCLPAR